MITDNLTIVQLVSHKELRAIKPGKIGWITLMSLWNAGLDLNNNAETSVYLSLNVSSINQKLLDIKDLVANNDISYQIMKDVNDRYFIIERNGKRTLKKGPVLEKEIYGIFLPLISFDYYKKQKK